MAFGIEVDKDVVRRVLAKHYRPSPHGNGPSWLTVIGHMKDSLWSVDLFRCESVLLRTHWVMVVMDQYTRRIIGFAVQPDVVDGSALCRMFNQVLFHAGVLPRHISTDNDPLFLFHRWSANLRILEIDEIKTVPYVPFSHPFVERLIGTIRRECLDHVLFWNAVDLERKLSDFKSYYNSHRVHASPRGKTPSAATGGPPMTPAVKAGGAPMKTARLEDHTWQTHCRGLYQLPVAA
jgi:transposase InsO family protein